jgi:hypothetical protein
VVDDASPDGTQEVARQLAGVYGEDKIVRRLPTLRASFLNLFCAGAQTAGGEIGPWVRRFYLRWLTYPHELAVGRRISMASISAQATL